MGIINTLAVNMPQVAVPSLDPVIGSLIKALNSSIGNICVTMIVFTLIIKLITLPLDYITRRSAKKNQLIQERLAPQIEKIEKQCGDDKQLAQRRKSELMKKQGFRMFGTCITSLVTIGLFIYIFTAVNSYSAYANAKMFNDMSQYYSDLTQIEEYYDEDTYSLTAAGKEELVKHYKELNPSFLWIKNPWRPDSYKGAIPTYSEFKSGSIGLKGIVIEEEFAQEQYDAIVGVMRDESKYKGWNGLLILPILAAGISFLSQFVTMKMQKKSQMPGQNQGMMKTMMFIFPAMMLYFALSYTSGLSIYIIFNSGLSTLSNVLLNKFIGRSVGKIKVKDDNTQSYRRR